MVWSKGSSSSPNKVWFLPKIGDYDGPRGRGSSRSVELLGVRGPHAPLRSALNHLARALLTLAYNKMM